MLIPFEKDIIEAQIISRPNRFIVIADINGVPTRCHCPVSGRIGGLTLDGQLALISGLYENRGTEYTVEAIALEPKNSPTFQWIGVNQTRCNSLVERFLQAGELASIFPEATATNVKREVKLEDHRIDFLVNGKTWIEVKTPVLKVHAKRSLEVSMKEFPVGNPSERLPKQMKVLTDRIALGERAAMVVVFQYKNTLGTSLKAQMDENIFPDEALVQAKAKGLEQYILTMSVSRQGIELASVAKF